MVKKETTISGKSLLAATVSVVLLLAILLPMGIFLAGDSEWDIVKVDILLLALLITFTVICLDWEKVHSRFHSILVLAISESVVFLAWIELLRARWLDFPITDLNRKSGIGVSIYLSVILMYFSLSIMFGLRKVKKGENKRNFLKRSK